MNQLLLLIYYHISLGSSWIDKEKLPKLIIVIKFSSLIYFQNFTNWSISLIGWFGYGSPVWPYYCTFLIGRYFYNFKLYLWRGLFSEERFFGIILLKRCQSERDQSTHLNQSGFRPRRGCMDQMHYLRRPFEQRWTFPFRFVPAFDKDVLFPFPSIR